MLADARSRCGGSGWRSIRNANGVVEDLLVAVRRGIEQAQRLSPARIFLPRSSKSSVAVRQNWITGVVQRTISSTAGVDERGIAAQPLPLARGSRGTRAGRRSSRCASSRCRRRRAGSSTRAARPAGSARAVDRAVGDHAHDVVASGLRAALRAPSRRSSANSSSARLLERSVCVVARRAGYSGSSGAIISLVQRNSSRPVAPRHAEQLGDHRDRERRRDVAHEVALLLAAVGRHRVEQVARDLLDLRARMRCDRARREALARDLAVLRVVGRIHVEQVARLPSRVGRRHVVGEDREPRRVQEALGLLARSRRCRRAS